MKQLKQWIVIATKKKMSDTQVCRKCNIEKPLGEFHYDKRTSTRKRTVCRGCRNEHKRITHISDAHRLSLLEEQNYSCAICSTPAHSIEKRLNVDHDHKTNQVRGLLCTYCNVGLGYFRDDTNLLAEAIKYLDKHNGIS